MVERCLRELRAECESLAGSIEDMNSSVFGDEESDDERLSQYLDGFEDEEEVNLSIQFLEKK